MKSPGYVTTPNKSGFLACLNGCRVVVQRLYRLTGIVRRIYQNAKNLRGSAPLRQKLQMGYVT
jgi:hypothetical protein